MIMLDVSLTQTRTSDTPTVGFGGTTLGATKGDVGIAIPRIN